MCQELTVFCICLYVFRCKLSLVRLCDSDFGITPIDGITIGITCAAFCFHTAHISFASSWYLLCLLVIVLVRLCVFGTAMSIKKGVLCFLIHKSYVRSAKRYCLANKSTLVSHLFDASVSTYCWLRSYECQPRKAFWDHYLLTLVLYSSSLASLFAFAQTKSSGVHLSSAFTMAA